MFRVPPEAAGMRADVFVQSQLRNTSRTRARDIVERTAFSREGRRIKPSDRVRPDDEIVLWRPSLNEDESPFEFTIIFEDEHLLVIDKPPLMAVHPTARHLNNTVLRRLSQARPGQFLSLIHRLDRDTSGLLLLGKSAESDRRFKRQIEDRSILAAHADTSASLDSETFQKNYLALCNGIPNTSLIDAPLEVDPDNSLRVKMRIAKEGGMPARTGITVLETRDNRALISCRLHTGRQHQIRVHLASIGCPIIGDKLYGPDDRLLARAADGELTDEDRALLVLPRHALHAAHYRLRHAFTQEVLDLHAPLPPDLSAYWASLPT
ncbi:MAG: RluA family pseudouridine synthase [Polyangiaceae bacterium]|nr:RluA family pseudouridine synthase [Polyangiaceae bacterium]